MDTDIVVIGAGVIGLAVAARLARAGRSVVLLEKERTFGAGISSRNTEVIHAGIYYKTGSLKARLCLRGKQLLYEHCEMHGIRHKRIGKLFLAVRAEERERLEMTRAQAAANGVDDLVCVDAAKLREMEPAVRGVAALFSPSTGIFDTHGFMKSLAMLGKDAGMLFVPDAEVTGADYASGEWRVMVRGQGADAVSCRVVVNAAGLYATAVSSAVFPERSVPALHPSKGCYVRLSGASPVRHIIYPAIVPGLIEERVDATPDLEGSLRFGPNIEEARSLEDFQVDDKAVEGMLSGIARYLPGIDRSKLHPDCAGIRPKIYGPRDPVEDFRFDWAGEPGWLDLWGMESPGLTSSLAIAEHVQRQIEEKDLLTKAGCVS